MTEELKKKRTLLNKKMDTNEDDQRWLKKQQDVWEELYAEERQQNERLCSLFPTGEFAHFFNDLRQEQQKYQYQLNENFEENRQALKKAYRQLEEDELELHLEERKRTEQEDTPHG